MGLLSKKFLNEAEEAQILAAIQDAEKDSSGEIRLHIEPWWTEQPIYSDY